MSVGTILLIVLILLLVGAIPSWPHSRNWGYGPSGGLGLVLVIILIIVLLLFGGRKIPELMRGLGKGVREFNDAKSNVKREIEENANEIKNP